MKKRLLCMLLTLVMIVSVGIGAFGASAGVDNSFVADDPINPDAIHEAEEENSGIDPNEIVTFMVKLSDKPVAAVVEDVNSKSATDLTQLLSLKQKSVRSAIASIMPEGELDVKFSYTMLFNGFAISAPYYMGEEIAKVEGVSKVFLAPTYAIPEDMEDEDTRLSTSVGLIGADDAWSAGYTGAGTTVAIIDTGIKVAHNAFSTAPSSPSMTTSTISTTLSNYALQAESLYSGTLTASNLYYSAKIPFRFNYNGGNTDVSHSTAGSDHGTHVAGIVAGNYSSSSYVGVAKNAQLVVMQVFNSDGGAEWSTILAALEDCAYLEVDAINMSLGSDCGFTTDGEEVENVYNLLYQHGVNIACAAGNSTTYYGSKYSYAFTMNMDNGLVSSPSTYTGSLSVAASTKSTSPSIASYSSWGTTADLHIKPEVTAPGSSIYSSTDSTYSGSEWGAKSGTSMASPHIAGAMAIMTGYVNSTFSGLTNQQKVDMINRLLMCTATPAKSSSTPYLVRAQGAGVIDLQKAITTKAYITVDGCDRPKLEIGDDKDKTGVYTLTFNIVNFGSSALTYTVTPYVLTEQYSSKTVNSQTTYAMAGSAWNITSSCTLSHNGTVTVPANSTVSYTVTVTLSSSLKTQLNTYFPSGAYIEGFIVLDGTVDLVVPYLGFYGNWNYASVIDRYTFIDEIKGNTNWSSINETIVGSVTSGTSYLLMGANPYITSTDWLADRCTLSPNSDTYYDKIDKVQLVLLRNAGECGITIYNEADPSTVYYNEAVPYMPKSWKYSGTSYYLASAWMDFSSWAPTDVAEGTTVVFKMYAYLDNDDFTAEQNECCEIVLPVTIDNTAPQVTYWNVDNGTLTVRVFDEHYAAWIGVYSNSSCTTLITEQAIAETTRGAYTDLQLSIGSYSTVYVKVGDYGHNTSAVLTLTGEGGSIEPVSLEGVAVTPASAEMLLNQTVALTLEKTPAEANNFEVVWSSSNTAAATVVGTKSGATVTSVAKGTTVITATATDKDTGAVYTATSTISVKNGYTYTRYEPTSAIETGVEYLIGYVSGSNVYLLMNYNPNPISSNNYYYSSSSNYYAYGVKAVTDGTNVTGVDTSAYSAATIANAEWKFVANGSYYYIQSAYDSSYYLRVYTSTTYTDLYPASGTTSATNWQWSAANNRLSYYASSSVSKYITYTATVGSYSNFFSGPSSAATGSTLQLYKKVTGTVIEDDTYTVTFVDWDGTVLSTQEVDAGGSATAPADPTRTGYTFTGWSGSYTNVTADVTITATYSILSYTVTFYGYNNAVLSTQTVNYGGSATAPTAPAVTGYTFTGWNGAYTNITANTSVYAIYTINTYTVTFYGYNNAVLSTQTVNYGGSATAPTAPAVTGYTFTGWNGAYTNITANTSVYAIYTINSYTVTFYGYNNVVLSTQTVNYGGSATAPTAPAVTGYTFTGWNGAYTNITANTSVYAIYTINTYTVTFYGYNNAVLSTQTVNYGGSATAPTAPAVTGYTFTGWNGEYTNITADTSIYAVYEQTTTILLGDVNCDGVITFGDVTALFRAITSDTVHLSEQGTLNADVNQDGSITLSDVSALYAMIFAS